MGEVVEFRPRKKAAERKPAPMRYEPQEFACGHCNHTWKEVIGQHDREYIMCPSCESVFDLTTSGFEITLASVIVPQKGSVLWSHKCGCYYSFWKHENGKPVCRCCGCGEEIAPWD